MKSKLEFVAMGIPLPGQYDGLRGIDLWGDGKVYNREDDKRKVKKKSYDGTLSQKIAKKTAEFKIFESPIFVSNGTIMSYQSFVEKWGDIVDLETYGMITDMYSQHNTQQENPFLYVLCESGESNPFSSKWYHIIKESLQKPNVKSNIHRIVTKFVNSNIDQMSSRWPTSNIMLTQSDIDMLMDLSGVKKDNVSEVVSEMIDSLNVKTDFKSISKSPHQIVCVGMLMASTELKDDELINDMITIVAFTMYPLIFRKYFPVTDPNSYAMEDAILNASKKFYISRTNSLLEWVRILTEVPYRFYRDEFSKGVKNDGLYFQFLNRLRNTMNQQFKSLYQIYKKSYDNKSISTLNSDEYVTLSSNTDKIESYTLGITRKIIDGGFKSKICKAAATYTKTSESNLSSYLKEIMSDPMKYDLSTMVQNIMTIYFNTGNSENFLSVAMKQYNKIQSAKEKIYQESNEYFKKLESQLREFDKSYLHRYTYGIYIYFSILISISFNNISNKLISQEVDSDNK